MGKAEVIIVAAGKGKRTKSKTLKSFIILQNRPLLFYSLRTFQDHPQIKEIILVVGKSSLRKAFALVKKYNFSKVKRVIIGGRQRKDSVINGLMQIDRNSKFVLIHDAARPFVKKDLISRILSVLKKYKAAIPGVPVQDTLKYIDKKGRVAKTLKRANIYSIQTPQGLRTEILPLLFRNYRKFKATYDDAMLVETVVEVKVITSCSENFKITTPYDLMLAKLYLSSQENLR